MRWSGASPLPAAARHWDRVAAVYERLANSWPLGAMRRRAVALLEPRGGGRYLLAGCGPALERGFFPSDCVVIGLDLAPAMLRRAAPRLRPGAGVRGDAQRLPFADGSFDGVVLAFICAVAPDGAAVLSEALRVTRPGGRVIVADKLRRGRETWLWKLWGSALRWTGSDFNRSLEAVLAGRGEAAISHDEAHTLGGYLALLRLERPAASHTGP